MFNFSIRDLVWLMMVGGLVAAAISQRLVHQQQIASIKESHQIQIATIEESFERDYDTIRGAHADAAAWAKYALMLESKFEALAANHPDVDFLIESGRPWTIVVHADQIENSQTRHNGPKRQRKPGSL